MSDATAMPLCPGCHFRCEITDYQCARGEVLHAKWAAEGTLPERRIPRAPAHRGEHKNMPKLTSDDRLMHSLHVVGIALADLTAESGSDAPDHRIADCLMRHERAASECVIQGRIHLSESDFDAAMKELESDGIIATRIAENDVAFYALTEKGCERAGVWRDERRAAEAEFLGVLSDEEKTQLHDLLFKVLEPGFKRRAQAQQGKES